MKLSFTSAAILSGLVQLASPLARAVDAKGKIRNIYSSGTLDARLVLADIRTLMMEKRQP